MKVVLLISIIFLLLLSNHVYAVNSETSIPNEFIRDAPQVLFLEIKDLSEYTEYSLTVFLENGSENFGFVLNNDEWVNNDKYPIKIITENYTEWKDNISFKINSTSILPGNYILDVALKTENSTIIKIASENIEVVDNISFVDIAFDLDENDFTEVSSPYGLLHRYYPGQFILHDFYGSSFFRFPVQSGINNLSYNKKQIEFNVSVNETMTVGNFYDMALEFNIDNTIIPRIRHDNILKIINNDHVVGKRENITVFITYNVTDFGTMKTFSYNFSKTGINSYTGTGTGFLELKEGKYEICAGIWGITKNGSVVIDENIKNNFICKNITVTFPKENNTCKATLLVINNETNFGKKYKFRIILDNFTDEKYLLKINSNDIISGKENLWYIIAEKNETEFEINFNEYSIYEVNISVITTSCNNENMTFGNISFFVSSIKKSDFGIKIEVENITHSIGENIELPIFIYNGLSKKSELNLSVAIKRKTQKGWTNAKEFSESNIILHKNSSLVLRRNISVDNNSISGYYKIYAMISDGNKTRYSVSYFSVSGLPDMGEENITILEFPEKLGFGGMGSVFIDFYSGNKDNIKGTFISYINKNLDTGKIRYPSIDFDFSTLYSKIYYSSSSVEIVIERGKHYFISLPIFINPNCDEKYAPGLYRGSVRAYLSENKNDFESADFGIMLIDGEDKFCKSSPVYCGTKSPETVNSSVPEEEQKNSFVFPRSVKPGEEFEVETDIKNDYEEPINISIYSYVFDGNKLLSEGFDGNHWGKVWNANKKEINVDGKDMITVKLKNRIKENVNPGTYQLRIRKTINGIKEDETKYIDVIKDDKPTLNEYDFNVSWESENDEFKIQTKTNCEDCSVIIAGPGGLLKYDRNAYHITKFSGIYNLFLVRNSSIINIKTENITNNISEIINKSDFDTNLKAKPEYNGISVTGAITQKNTDLSWLHAIINYLRFFI